jgi:hypothetical protein
MMNHNYFFCYDKSHVTEKETKQASSVKAKLFLNHILAYSREFYKVPKGQN